MTALILHPTAATPKPVTTIHPQSARIERDGVTLPELDVHLTPATFQACAGRLDVDYPPKRHRQRSPHQRCAGMIAEDSVARAYRLVRTLKAENPAVQAVLDEIRHRLHIANPFADR